MPHQDGTFLLEEWTYLYIFNLQIFIIYIYLLKSLFLLAYEDYTK